MNLTPNRRRALHARDAGGEFGASSRLSVASAARLRIGRRAVAHSEGGIQNEVLRFLEDKNMLEVPG